MAIVQTPGPHAKFGDSPRLTQFAVEAAAEAMFMVSADGLILDTNQMACERLEYSRDELIGMHVADFDPHYSAERWPGHFEELRRTGRMTFETQHRSKGGRLFDVDVSVSYVKVREDEYACGWVRETGRRKDAERLLRLQREVIAKTATTSGDQTPTLNMLCGLVEELVPNSLVTVMLLNKADSALWFAAGPGLTPEVCAAFEPLRPAEDAGSCGSAAHLKRAVIVSDTRTSPHWRRLQGIVDQFNLLACWSIPILDEQDEVLGTFAISHTQHASPTEFQRELLEMSSSLASIAIGRQRSEQQLQVAQNELAHFNRQSTMGEMASGLAHELNQPLTAMANEAYVLEMISEQDSPQIELIRERAKNICAQTMRAGEIVRGMRNLARKQVPSRISVDANSVVDSALKIMGPELRSHDIRMRWTPSQEPALVSADSVQIQQVLINLIRNAIDAMRDVEPYEREVAVAVRSHGSSELAISISDTGPGIPFEDPRTVFDAFHTTKPDGMGLGLTICQSIAAAHGGRLEVEHVQPHGTAFSLFLPVDRTDGGDST